MIGTPLYNSAFSQPSITCPDYSFCVEIDPLDCDKIKVSINGLSGEQIAGLRFIIDVSLVQIDIQATNSAFQSTAIYQHFSSPGNTASLSVDQNSIIIQYTAHNSLSVGYQVAEDCLFIGEIILETLEVDCLPDVVLNSIQIVPFTTGPGPLFLGPNLPNSIGCSQYTIDCPCSGDCPIDDWFFCFAQDGCNAVNVLVLELEADDVSGIRFGFVFDPELEIDIDQTKNSIQTSAKLGGNSWEFANLNVTQNTISFYFGNETGLGANVDFDGLPELLFKIFFIPQPGVCYDFGAQGVSYFSQSGIFIGDHLNHPEVVFCDNYSNICSGQVCTDGVKLGGIVQRPTPSGSCDEGIDFGFPYGEVVVNGAFCGYEYEFVTLTDEDGYYELEVFPNTEYLITPNYTEEHREMCGVNSIDQDIVRKNILDTNCFTEPFQYLAGDIYEDDTIDVRDIALFTQWFLGLNSDSIKLWTFIPVNDYLLFSPNPPANCNNSFPSYPKSLLNNIGLSNSLNNNFFAIKMGDVDGSCQQCLETSSLESPPSNLLVSAQYDVGQQQLVLEYSDYRLENVTVVNLFIGGGNSFKFHNEKHENITETYMEIRVANSEGISYGWISLEETGKTILHDQIIAAFPIEQFDSSYGLDMTFGEIVADGVLYTLELTSDFVEVVEKSPGSRDDSSKFALFPNPGGDHLYINLLVDTDDFVVSIKDILGRRFGKFQAAGSDFEINTCDFPSGTYVITVKNEEIHESRVWIKN
ncbi:MAG: T9SS C-terminal target domain-containing protein [Saprospirales bacterium]|nr:MAG: T9SS C-terminal target domain-containing protein [Saprospirales bacterium]